MTWVSASKFHLSLVGVVGFAGFILAVKRDGVVGALSSFSFSWFGSHRIDRLQGRYTVPGLQNLGNNCFLNVILQALASSSHFQPYLTKVLEECETMDVEDNADMLPLTVSLNALFRELSMLSERRVVLSPRRVMLAMSHYIPNFSLTSQQDAAEALLHLISCLREEFSEWYVPIRSPLAVLSDSAGRILSSKSREHQSEWKRWQRHFLGPFDGIIGSFLTCQSCSSQISLNLEFFHTLLLSPVLFNSSTIMVGCTLQDCLKRFVAAERVANYRCSHCWHVAAIKYLSLIGARETDIMKVKSCSDRDSCDCENHFNLKSLPWSNDFSRTVRRSSISRSPEILCIQLQRASVNEVGELVKLQGHISFPMALDMSPYMTGKMQMQHLKEYVPIGQGNLDFQQPCTPSSVSKVHMDTKGPCWTSMNAGQNLKLRALVGYESGFAMKQQGSKEELRLACGGPSSNHLYKDSWMRPDGEHVTRQKFTSASHLYRLISVVEHFGRTGSGHYTVYRSARPGPDEEEDQQSVDPSSQLWFHISDSTVSNVSESEVLAAEASLLFYERLGWVEGCD